MVTCLIGPPRITERVRRMRSKPFADKRNRFQVERNRQLLARFGLVRMDARHSSHHRFFSLQGVDSDEPMGYRLRSDAHAMRNRRGGCATSSVRAIVSRRNEIAVGIVDLEISKALVLVTVMI